jgi:tetratricopeptide (TPR) repeat protein
VTSPTIEELRSRIEALRETLDSGGDRDVIRQDLIRLTRETEEAIAKLQELRDELGPLARRYRELFPREEAAPPGRRVDHLGAATFRERGWSALAGGEYERAARELSAAIELDPEDPAAAAMLAWAHVRLEDWEAASGLIARGVGGDGAYPLAQVVAALLDLRAGSPELAVERLDAVVRAGTDRTATMYAHLYSGVAREAAGELREAQASYRRAIELGPNLTEAFWELGRCLLAAGQQDLALDVWRAGGENRFNPWGERCREAVERLESEGRPESV